MKLTIEIEVVPVDRRSVVGAYAATAKVRQGGVEFVGHGGGAAPADAAATAVANLLHGGVAWEFEFDLAVPFTWRKEP